MASLVPLILEVLYKNKIMTKEEIVQEISREIDIEPDKVMFRVEKLIGQGKIYKYQEEGFALENHGDLLEKEIEHLMNNIFYKPYVFINPKIKDGAQELCDLLVYFDNTLILFQAKVQKFTGNYERFVKKAVENSLSQLETSINRCKNTGFDIELTDIYGRSLKIDKTIPLNIIGICVAYQIEPILSSDKARLTYNLKPDSMNEIPHILSNEELRIICKYFDTPRDFIDYLAKRAFICKNPSHAFVSEKDIISMYYRSERTMLPKDMSMDEYEKASIILFDGMEDDLNDGELSKQIEDKKKKDKVSYGVDEFIHSIESKSHKNFEETKVVKFFHDMNRFDRRILGESIFKKFRECIKNKKNFGYFVSTTKQTKDAYLVIFSNLDMTETEKRASLLLKLSKMRLNKDNAIAIVFQSFFKPETLSYRFMLNENKLSNEEIAELKKTESSFFGETKEESLYEFD